MRASKLWAAAAAVVAAFIAFAPAPARAQSDAAIRDRIVRASIRDYPRTRRCPCPYYYDRAGRRCGRRSAYNRPGGYAPKCYPRDVTAAEVKAYRAGR